MWLDDLNEAGKAPLRWSLQMLEFYAELITKWWGLCFLGLVALVLALYLLQWMHVL
jgi:hypothetical protein